MDVEIGRPIETAAAVIALAGTIYGVGRLIFRRLFRRIIRSKDDEIEDLKKDLRHRTESLEEARAGRTAAEARCVELEGRLAEKALSEATRQWRFDNYIAGNRILAEWLDREGENISKLLLHRAEWAIAHAAGDFRAAGFVVAEAYATAALCVWPADRTPSELLDDIVVLKASEGQSLPSLKSALAQLDESAADTFEPDLVENANVAETEARRRWLLGHYHAALPVVDRALVLRYRTVGPAAAQTFRTQRLKANILDSLGHTDEALPIARAVAQAFEASPAFGPQHPDTLASRYLVAQLLDRLGHTDEALTIARAVAQAYEASPAFGPQHPDTLASRNFAADLLARLREKPPNATAA